MQKRSAPMAAPELMNKEVRDEKGGSEDRWRRRFSAAAATRLAGRRRRAAPPEGAPFSQWSGAVAVRRARPGLRDKEEDRRESGLLRALPVRDPGEAEAPHGSFPQTVQLRRPA